ncbi:MAG TPA: DNA sulfur modification protein DndD [Dissulfurispiraceae bacterium]|nr:DNA sulfur modification protein DndD [Dissulfurispiraceae bacterium]
MIIRRMAFSNFGVYGGEQAVEPANPLLASGRGITIIGGLNGWGKTSLLDGVLLVLYGSRSPAMRNPRRSYSSYLRGLVNRNSPEGAEAWVEIDLVTGSPAHPASIRVRRSWEGSKRIEERLQVWRDGHRDDLLASGWDSYVDELIPVGLASLFFFDGDRIGDLAESDEPPEEMRTAIHRMLDLDIIDDLILDLSSLTRTHQSRLGSGDVQKELSALQLRKTSLLVERVRTKQDIARANTDLERLSQLVQRKHEEYLRRGGSLVRRQQSLLDRQQQLREAAHQAQSAAVAAAAGPLPLLLTEDLLRRIRDRVADEKAAREARLALPIIQARNRELLEALRRYSKDQRIMALIQARCRCQEMELLRLAQGTELLPLSAQGIALLDGALDVRFEELRLETSEILGRMRDIEEEWQFVERHAAVEVNREEVAASLDEVTSLARRAADLEQVKANLAKTVAGLDREMKEIDGDMAALADRLVGSEESERVIKYATRSRLMMETFRERVAERKVALLADRIAEAFALLTHKRELTCQVRIDPRTLRIALLNNQGEEISRSELSSGEKQMLALAVLWGLARASNRRLPVIIDAPMGRLDSSHRLNFVAQYLPNASHQVIVLSTDTEIVGPYLQYLAGHIGQTYLLDHDEEQKQTKIREGYFSDRDGLRG